LIENNTRRIQILDEMAHAIYREWFVEFRYPGHDGVPLVDSDLGRIPEGWRALTWGDLATLDYGRALRGYKDATADYPVFGTNGLIGWHDAPLFGPGVVVGRKGAYRGIHLSSQPCWVIDTAFYLNIRDAKQIDPLFAYYQLRTVDLDSIDSGSAIPSTSRAAFYAIPLVVPPANIVQRFSDVARDMFQLKRTLENSSAVLRTTRDLLLPRLISGEIDVSELNIDGADVAA
jgi:type I restriction enzyme S subunit